MGELSLTPARDAAEKMLASFEAEQMRRRAMPGLDGVTARIANPLTATLVRLIADEADAGTDFSDVFTAACRALVNAAGSVGATLLTDHDTVTGAVEVLKDALELAESRLGSPSQCLQTDVWQRGGGRA